MSQKFLGCLKLIIFFVNLCQSQTWPPLSGTTFPTTVTPLPACQNVSGPLYTSGASICSIPIQSDSVAFFHSPGFPLPLTPEDGNYYLNFKLNSTESVAVSFFVQI